MTPRWHVPLLLLLGLPVFFLGLASYSVVNGDEGIYHTIAATMVERGDWTHLDYHGQHRVYDTFMNAPTQYWARAILISLFGDGLWTMRILSAAAGLATVVLVYRLVALIDPRPGRLGPLLAALVQLTSFQFVYLHGARTGELDAVVCLLLVLLAITFLRAVQGERSFVAHHVCLVLLLTVKLPAVLIPVVAELALFATTRSARGSFGRYVRAGLVVVPLGLVWHAFQAASLWDEFREVATKMTGEAGGSVGGGEYVGGPLENLRWYAAKALHGLFPWSIALLPAALAIGIARKEDDERTGWRLALFLAVAVWLFFLVVSKRMPWYVMPSYPFVAAAVGVWLSRCTEGRRLDVVLAAAVLGVVLCLRVPATDVRPLIERAARFPAELSWASGGALLLGGIAVAAGGLHLAIRSRLPRLVPTAVLLVLLCLAAVRVGRPLGSLEHESELARLAAQLEEDRSAGRPIRYPVAIPESEGWLRVQFHFGRRFLAVKRGNAILLQGEKPGRDGL